MTRSRESVSRPFPWRVRQWLCEHLLALPEMHAPDRRDQLIDQLARDFPGLRAVVRHANPQADMLEFVTAANDYKGALRGLLEVLTFLYPSDDRLRSIRQLIGTVEPEDLLTPEERQQIIDHLDDVDRATVAGAFYYSTRSMVEEADLDLSDVEAIVARVESLPASPNRLPPLFDFIDYTAHSSHQATKTILHDWMYKVSERIGYANRSTLDAICRATDNRLNPRGRYFLVTEVTPDSGAPDKYFLAAWRQHEDEPEEPLYQSDRSVPWEEAIKTIHTLMQKLAAAVEHTAQKPILELILPRSLVTQSVDQWLVNTVLRSPIGTVYPLVLRSYDRLSEGAVHADWGRNWAWLKAHGRAAGANALREVNSHGPDSAEALRRALLLEGPPAAVHMIEPLPESDDLAADAFTGAILGGAPIMTWSRDQTTAADLTDWIRGVCHENLLDLPARVFQLRLQARDSADGTSAGTHVALVYDDHDRIPERFRSRCHLRSPKRRQSTS